LCGIDAFNNFYRQKIIKPKQNIFPMTSCDSEKFASFSSGDWLSSRQMFCIRCAELLPDRETSAMDCRVMLLEWRATMFNTSSLDPSMCAVARF